MIPFLQPRTVAAQEEKTQLATCIETLAALEGQIASAGRVLADSFKDLPYDKRGRLTTAQMHLDSGWRAIQYAIDNLSL